MDMRGAFDDLIAFAEEKGMAAGPPSFGLDHLKDMRGRITDDFSPAKLGRWLGWAQCCVALQGYASLEEMKQMNLARSSKRRTVL